MSDYEVSGYEVSAFDVPDYEMLDSALVGPPEGATAQHPRVAAREAEMQAILRSIAIGAVAGMRSITPLAFLAAAAQEPGTPVAQAVARMRLLRRLGSRPALIALSVAALGEYVGDQLPVIPARVSFGPLLGRVIIGAVAGAVASSAWDGSATRGAKRGAAAAFISAWVTYQARIRLTRRTPIPDSIWGAAGDLIAVGLGIIALLPSLKPSVRYLRSQL